jgi:hypothetical protein
MTNYVGQEYVVSSTVGSGVLSSAAVGGNLRLHINAYEYHSMHFRDRDAPMP